ncbi:hypothetical protein V6N12_065184 [Hibiscus sabdariffa]|uniref:Jasmonate O-methyltransferase n=1 Tax=Hibiscus sabdariffa TaxID=183260 RepID=A0ABR2G8Z5_9ROSI
MQEAILEMIYNNVVELESMGIADLGCSLGPNTLSIIFEIMDTLDAANHHLGSLQQTEYKERLESNPFLFFHSAVESQQ